MNFLRPRVIPPLVGSEEVGNMLHGHKKLRAEDKPQFDENRGTDMIADTSKADIAGRYKAHRVQRKDLPFSRPDVKALEFKQGRASGEKTLRNNSRVKTKVFVHA